MALLAVGFVARVLRSPRSPKFHAKQNGEGESAKEPCPAVVNPLSRRERGRGEGEHQWASRPVLCGYMGRASLFGVTSCVLSRRSRSGAGSHGEAGSLYGTVGLSEATHFSVAESSRPCCASDPGSLRDPRRCIGLTAVLTGGPGRVMI